MVKPVRPQRWNLTPRRAMELQDELRRLVRPRGRPGQVRLVAGADVAFPAGKSRAVAGVVVLTFPDLEVVEEASAWRPLRFPYVPGLLSFREGPALLAALARLGHRPDVLFFDAQGLAHPRRFGLACHMGVLLDVPAIGCAKSRLVGEASEPGLGQGAWTPLRHQGETVGAVVRTRDEVRPVYVSVGHRIGLQAAVNLTLACCDGLRIPRPTRLADRLVGTLKRQRAARAGQAAEPSPPPGKNERSASPK